MQQQQQRHQVVELDAEPSKFHSGEFRAVIRVNGRMSYCSGQSFPTADIARTHAALVYAGEREGYKY